MPELDALAPILPIHSEETIQSIARLHAEHRADATRFWFIESKGPKLYTEAKFSPADYLVFGRETAGLPGQLLEQNRECWLRIPMFNKPSRSLNLSNCAALVLFEALRQQGFAGEI